MRPLSEGEETCVQSGKASWGPWVGVGTHLPNTGLPCQAVTLHSTQHLAQSPCSLEVKLGRVLHGERMRKEGGLRQPQLHLQVLASWAAGALQCVTECPLSLPPSSCELLQD